MFVAGFLGWTWDFDFLTVSMTITEISQNFGVSYSDMSWGMTVTLMLHSVGAIVFGILADRYGRKWPMIINLFLFIILEPGSGFCNTLPQFLGVRSLYGIAMGGYLLAAAFYRALVPTTSHGWRTHFWFGARPPILIILFRLWLPETNHFQVMKAEREARASAAGDHAHTMGFHAQDFYPTFLKDQVGMNATDTTVITVVGQLGALLGGCTIGYISIVLGRRLTMLVACVFGGAFIPAYMSPRTMSLSASAFFQQFFVGRVWGPMPIHLLGLSAIALRSFMVGLTYQLGNPATSASATSQSIIGERYPLSPGPGEKKSFDYGKVIAIFMGAVWAFIVFFLFWGSKMSQEERDEAEAALRLERLRAEGVSLAEIGQQKLRDKNVDEHDGKEKVETAHVEC
ncbi:uncharacterized protein N7459_000315 [Penicillium hispanicum]|uniref:uncharacterized protein n=1 Tax=Penicillium hispanicum TaxID=1080232 RepID=UPI00253F9A37|nr:uncharacterized protein N7459_000315 [Penicillium hispanicum]KAJ5594107.1 hypothetical protein N7459_000315 [Penicillium hispanicum]